MASLGRASAARPGTPGSASTKRRCCPAMSGKGMLDAHPGVGVVSQQDSQHDPNTYQRGSAHKWLPPLPATSPSMAPQPWAPSSPTTTMWGARSGDEEHHPPCHSISHVGPISEGSPASSRNGKSPEKILPATKQEETR